MVMNGEMIVEQGVEIERKARARTSTLAEKTALGHISMSCIEFRWAPE
jgi:hypothetical protein